MSYAMTANPSAGMFSNVLRSIAEAMSPVAISRNRLSDVAHLSDRMLADIGVAPHQARRFQMDHGYLSAIR